MATTKARMRKATLPALRIGDDAVREKTGRTWEKWIAALDRAGARALDHAALAKLLRERFALSPWWSQTVAVGYEQATGKRVPSQRATGFSTGASRTLPVPLERLRAAWTDGRARRRWLDAASIAGGAPGAGGTIRGRWGDGPSRIEVRFEAVGAERSRITIDHERLPDAAEAARMKTFWRERLDALQALLERA